ncbi:MAG: hypothetical protein ETSY2_12025 [Candidatus Entotheonella gemina]|uniref:Uncharacterized protein n=2 Tax=Candidatus Entotheonella TaxID=93171 RepID=W4MAC1_9BACT|nr:MAG: hypothetical protein ETSY2_12025 [Candidatus Entotheonella gemina]
MEAGVNVEQAAGYYEYIVREVIPHLKHGAST